MHRYNYNRCTVFVCGFVVSANLRDTPQNLLVVSLGEMVRLSKSALSYTSILVVFLALRRRLPRRPREEMRCLYVHIE